MNEKEKIEHETKLIISFERGVEDLVNGGIGLPWEHPDHKAEKSQPKWPEMI